MEKNNFNIKTTGVSLRFMHYTVTTINFHKPISMAQELPKTLVVVIQPHNMFKKLIGQSFDFKFSP